MLVITQFLGVSPDNSIQAAKAKSYTGTSPTLCTLDFVKRHTMLPLCPPSM